MSSHSRLPGLVPMLRLDLANLGSWRRAGPLVLVALAFMTWSSGVSMASVMLYVGGFLLATNAFTMDGKYRLPLLYGGLPVTRRTVITAHHLMAVAAMLVAALLVIPCAAISHLALGSDVGAEIRLGVTTVLGTSVVLAVLLPFIARFGIVAITYAALGMLAVAGFLGLFVRVPNLAALTGATAWLSAHTGLAQLLVLAVVAAIWMVSYLVSVRWYEAQDF